MTLAQTSPPRTITNTVSVDYVQSGIPSTVIASDRFVFDGQPVSLAVHVLGTGPPMAVGASRFSTSGTTAGPFSHSALPKGVNGAPLDLSLPIPLVTVPSTFRGGALFVSVDDKIENADATVREAIVIKAAVSNEVEFVELRETGPDTGLFTGYVLMSHSAPIGVFDGTLPMIEGASVAISHGSPSDPSHTVATSLLLDPYGRVFDSSSGATIDGAIVSVVEAATGAPAHVFGDDGVSPYPSRVVSGVGVTDGAGIVYPGQPGGYRFPRMSPGTYRIIVTPPSGFKAPSAAPPAPLQTLDGAPFAIDPVGSYGGPFGLSNEDIVLDIPVDPLASEQIRLNKSASVSTAAIGDIVWYTIRVGPTGSGAQSIVLEDRLPEGFSLLPDSVRVDGVKRSPTLSAGRNSFTLALASIAKGHEVEVRYALQAGLRARRGFAVNRAQATSGTSRSNVAEVGVLVRDDLMRDVSVIAGRISAGAIRGGQGTGGIAGVRLYLEDGTSVVTDPHGRFSFESVKPGLHVVQLDPATLPPAYAPSRDGLTTRNAGRGHSAFVEVRPGALAQTNFCLEAKARAGPQPNASAPPVDASTPVADSWAPGFLFPEEGQRLTLPILSVGVAHRPGDRVDLRLNGHPVDALTYEGTAADKTGPSRMRSSWRGIAVKEGAHALEAFVYDAAGLRIAHHRRQIILPGAAHRAEVDTQRSALVADGQTKIVLALLLRDESGRPSREGERIEVSVEPPFQFDTSPVSLTAVGRGVTPRMFAVGPDGIALLTLEPALTSGEVRARVRVRGREIPLSAWITRPQQNWLVVGLAEAGMASAGSTADPSLTTHALAKDILDGARLAVFGRGPIGDDWMLRFSYDSARARDAFSERLFQDSARDQTFPLFGDASRMDREAETSGPLFVRIERPQAFAQYGDFDTGLTTTDLTRYGRRLHGLQGVYSGKLISASLFASNATDSFQRDEIPGNGTSGPYRLSTAPLVINSERITIEIRDRTNTAEILSARVLTRHLDYEIDYDSGVVQLRDVLWRTGSSLNPNVLIAEYEVAASGKRALNYGGRLAALLFDDRIQVGASFIHEGTGIAGRELRGLDVALQLLPSTRLMAEIAETVAVEPGAQGYAQQIKLEHLTESLSANLTARRQEPGFGLGQESARRAGVQSLSSDVMLRLSEQDSITLRALHMEQWEQGFARNFAEAAFQHKDGASTYRLGLQSARDSALGDENLRSDLVFAEVISKVFGNRLTVGALHAEPLGAAANPDYPARTVLSANWAMSDAVSIFAAQEWRAGDAFEGGMTRAGIVGTPWIGGRVTASGALQTAESATRLLSNLGLSWTFDENWVVSAALDARETVNGTAQSFLPDELRIADWTGEDYLAVSLGLARNTATLGFSGRLEGRQGETEDRVLLQMSQYTESGTIGLANDFMLQASRTTAGHSFPLVRFRQGLAVRSDWLDQTVLYRLDLLYRERPSETASTAFVDGLRQGRLVGNMLLHIAPAPRVELGLQLGLKFTYDEIESVAQTGFAGLIGADLRYDILPWLDLGLSGSAAGLWPSGEWSQHLGISLGFTPAENLWFSVGINLLGYEEADFVGGATFSEGVFARVRLKFDQDTARGILMD